MDRRTWIGATAGGLLAMPRFACAQSAQRIYRVGILRPAARPLSPDDPQLAGIPNGLRELGYVQGRNLVIEQRFANGEADRLPALARELVRAKVDVIVAVAAAAVLAAKEATATIPIVMYGNFEPVALGFAASLARPGGNITGVLIAPDGTLAAKRLELLKAVAPQARRIAHLTASGDPAMPMQLLEADKAAAALGIELIVVEVRGGDYARGFAIAEAKRAGALLVGSSSIFLRDRKEIIALAATHRLPAMYEWREQVVDGGLMAYGTSLQGVFRRVATYVDRILKGAVAGDMPIERPTTFELVLNKSTARALGLTIAQPLLLRVDELIE